jgi:REP element-mobilizing transposase RayT
MHNLFKRAWSRWTDYPVGYYTILPDHLHLMIRDLGQNRRSLCTWVSNWKGHVSRNWNGTGVLWQRSFWDRQMRSAEDYNSKYLYVRNNPVRHGLVTETEDWPYQGEMTDI